MPSFSDPLATTSSNCCTLGLGLLDVWKRVEVERLPFCVDRLPRQVVPNACEAPPDRHLSGARKTSMLRWRRAPAARSSRNFWRPVAPGYRSSCRSAELRAEDDQARLGIVRYVGGRSRRGVNLAKSPRWPARVAATHAAADLLIDVIVGEVGRGPVLREAGNRWLQGEPVALTVDVEVGRLVRQTAQRVTEGGRSLSRLDAAQLDRAIVDPTVRRSAESVPNRGRSSEPLDGSRSTARGWVLAVESERQRIRPVDVALDDRRPTILEVPRQLRRDTAARRSGPMPA